MARIEYDPIKDRFARLIRNSRLLRRIFYFILDLLFLRSWHIRKLIRRVGDRQEEFGSWKMLDAGNGFGQYDRFILKRFRHVDLLALEVKDEYLEACRHYFKKEITRERVRFDKQDLRTFETKERFDLVICIDVLEHIEEDEKVIRNLAASLCSGGCLLMHSPSHFSEKDAGKSGEESFTGEHARTGYSKEEISSKFRRSGLHVEQVRYTYGWFGHLSWVWSVKIPMILFNRMGMWAMLPLLPYYMVILGPCLLMNLVDLYTPNREGTGIYALGVKRS